MHGQLQRMLEAGKISRIEMPTQRLPCYALHALSVDKRFTALARRAPLRIKNFRQARVGGLIVGNEPGKCGGGRHWMIPYWMATSYHPDGLGLAETLGVPGGA